MPRPGSELDAERKQRAAEEEAVRKAHEERDNADYARLIDQGQKQLAAAKYDAAISTFQGALRLKKTAAAEALLSQATIAGAKSDVDRKNLERQLEEEKNARRKAEAASLVNQEKYLTALQIAQKAMVNRDYDSAIVKFNEAGKYCQTDVVLTGLKQAQAAQQQQHVIMPARCKPAPPWTSKRNGMTP